MRLAKRTQCPNCKQKWGVRVIDWVYDTPVRRCNKCGWMPKSDRRMLEVRST